MKSYTTNQSDLRMEQQTDTLIDGSTELHKNNNNNCEFLHLITIIVEAKILKRVFNVTIAWIIK